VRYVV